MRRREFIGLVGGVAAWPRAARAQQVRKVWRIGVLVGRTRPPSIESSMFGGFLEGMRQLGYVEQEDFTVEWRFADGKYERFREIATEFVQLKVDVILVTTSAGIRAAQQATSVIPIVMGYSIDPVGNGLVKSLARPGGNTTGLASSQESLVSKHVELVAEAVPGVSRIAIIVNPDNPNHPGVLKRAQTAAQRAGFSSVEVPAKNPQEMETAFAAMTTEKVGAAVILPDSFFSAHREHIAAHAIRDRLPTMFAQGDYVQAGGLMSYGESFKDFFYRAARFVDRIIKGAKPADLPIEQPTRFFLVINLKTAKELGLTIPPSLVARADEVIE